MNNLTINNTNIAFKTWNGQPVITFKDVDLVHQRPNGTAKDRFNHNRQRFIENEDFFFVKPQNVQKYENHTFKIPPRGLILLTETGYLLLAKSLTDDRAWQVQRQLINCYFKVKENQQPEQMKLPEPTYEYKPKYYKGVMVLTFEDISAISGKDRTTLCIMIKGVKFKENLDYKLLKGEELEVFKKENSCISNYTSCITILYKSGIEKIAKALKFNFPQLKEMENEPKNFLIPPANDMHLFIKATYSELEAVKVVIKNLDRYNTPAENECLRNVLYRFERSLSTKLSAIAAYDISTIKGELRALNTKTLPFDRQEYYRKRANPDNVEFGFYEEPLSMILDGEDPKDKTIVLLP